METSIDIHAPASAVWAQVVEVPAIRPEETRPALFTRLGFPRPLHATLDHAGVGGHRYAHFERGVLFIETITDWAVDAILRSIQENILEVLKARAETPAAARAASAQPR